MVIFQENYETEISDKLSEDDYAESVKKQVIKFHKHSDGSLPHFKIIDPSKEELMAVHEFEQKKKPVKETRRIFSEERNEHNVQAKRKMIDLSCNCGKHLIIRPKENGIEVTYLKPEEDVAGYGGPERGVIEYGTRGGQVDYDSKQGNIKYGGN